MSKKRVRDDKIRYEPEFSEDKLEDLVNKFLTVEELMNPKEEDIFQESELHDFLQIFTNEPEDKGKRTFERKRFPKLSLLLSQKRTYHSLIESIQYPLYPYEEFNFVNPITGEHLPFVNSVEEKGS